MATLPTNVVSDVGLNPTGLYLAANGGGDKCATGQGVVLHVKNGHTSPQTVTLVSPQVYQGDLTVTDRAVAVPNAGERFIAVPDFYRGTDGLASITYSGVTALTIAALRV